MCSERVGLLLSSLQLLSGSCFCQCCASACSRTHLSLMHQDAIRSQNICIHLAGPARPLPAGCAGVLCGRRSAQRVQCRQDPQQTAPGSCGNTAQHHSNRAVMEEGQGAELSGLARPAHRQHRPHRGQASQGLPAPSSSLFDLNHPTPATPKPAADQLAACRV